jgi:hypothetical protein
MTQNNTTKENKMNIDDLTIGEAKQLASLLSGNTPTTGIGITSVIGKKAIIRTYSAGVWFGMVSEKSGDEIILSNAIRMNYFKTVSGISLSSVAVNGIHKDSRLAEPVGCVWLNPIEIIPCTDKAIISIESHKHE